jgi:hypothetical protein
MLLTICLLSRQAILLSYLARRLERVHVGMSALAFALKVFTTNQAAVDVQCTYRDGALLVKVKVEHVPPYLTEVRTEDLLVSLLSFLWLIF